MSRWIAGSGQERKDLQPFLNLKEDLSNKGLTPDISHYERVCRMTVTGAFLKQKEATGTERKWFAKKLPKRLKRLRNARRRAEHETANTWARSELKEFIDEFFGIGQPGIIQRLTKILF